MKKSTYHWVSKWHLIGGLVSFPVIFILSVTGIIYLFKDSYEKPRHASLKEVQVNGERLPYQEQWQIAREFWGKKINSMVIPGEDTQATEFISGRFSGKSSLFVDPYTGEATGDIVVADTDMFKIRKLHGELLMGRFGTKIVELVGSWMIVLILSGLLLFFPRKKKDWAKLFRIRFKAPRHVLFKDIHMVAGFWFSMVLLLILAGGMPWTDVWGAGFKWVQKQTSTGYPPSWQGHGITSQVKGDPVSLDYVVDYARQQQLSGTTTISLPQTPEAIYSVHNTYYPELEAQVAIHLDQYSGEALAHVAWQDVGFLMRGRMWAMAFHQGQFGLWNWVLILVVASGLLILSTAAIASYFFRKKRSNISTPTSYRTGVVLYLFAGIMGIFLPLFGLSVIAIILIEQTKRFGLKFSKRSPASAG